MMTLAPFGKPRAGSARRCRRGTALWARVPRGAERKANGTVVASVRPDQVPNDDPLAGCDGATSIILFQMDVIHGLTLSEIHPDAVTTAYGPLADFLTIARGQSR